MAEEDVTPDAGGVEAKRAAKAAYMREYRKKNPAKQRALDKVLAERKKAKNPEKFKAAGKARQQRYQERKKAARTPEERERLKADNRRRNAKYREVNREAVRKRAAEGRRRRYAKDPTKELAVVHRRRSQIKAGNVTASEWREIKERYGSRCAYCRAGDVRLTMDHVKPLSKGGQHTPENVVPACRPCNNKKNAQEWPRPEPPQP